MAFTPDELGKIVRDAWVRYCIETGDTVPSHVAEWDALSESEKEVDRQIGEAIRDAVLYESKDKVIHWRTIDNGNLWANSPYWAFIRWHVAKRDDGWWWYDTDINAGFRLGSEHGAFPNRYAAMADCETVHLNEAQ